MKKMKRFVPSRKVLRATLVTLALGYAIVLEVRLQHVEAHLDLVYDSSHCAQPGASMDRVKECFHSLNYNVRDDPPGVATVTPNVNFGSFFINKQLSVQVNSDAAGRCKSFRLESTPLLLPF
jgi:hypothetical protein